MHIKKDREESRQKKYQKLRNAGFPSRLANKYKDHSWKKVNKLIEQHQEFNDRVDSIIKGGV